MRDFRRHSLFFLCMFVFMAHTAFAEYNYSSTKAFERTRSHRLEPYQLQRAINGLCWELNLDLCRSTMQENLSLILSSPLLSAEQRAEVLLIEDLFHYIENVRQQIDYLTLKRDQMQKHLVEQGHDHLRIEDDLTSIQKNAGWSDVVILDQGKIYSDHDGSIGMIIGILTDQKEQLIGQWQYLQEQYQWLAKINKNKDETSAQQVYELTDQPIAIFAKDIVPAKKYDMAEEFDDQVYSEDTHPEASRRLDNLAEQIVDLSLKMSEMELLLQKKAELITSLQDKLNDVEQRFLLGQRIIQEKDNEISSLNNALRQGEGVDRISMSKDKKLIELNGILSIYKDKLLEEHQSARDKAEMITVLEERLDDMQNQMNKKDEVLVKTRGDLRSLQEKLNVLEIELKNIKSETHQKGTQSFNIDKEIDTLQSKFRDLQHFLLENLHDSDRINAHVLIPLPQP